MFASLALSVRSRALVNAKRLTINERYFTSKLPRAMSYSQQTVEEPPASTTEVYDSYLVSLELQKAFEKSQVNSLMHALKKVQESASVSSNSLLRVEMKQDLLECERRMERFMFRLEESKNETSNKLTVLEARRDHTRELLENEMTTNLSELEGKLVMLENRLLRYQIAFGSTLAIVGLGLLRLMA
eukprot:g3944.t1